MGHINTIRSLLKAAEIGESLYLQIWDGHCSGTEFVWLPNAERWVWYDLDARRSGSSETLTLITSAEDGDSSGLNRMPGLITVDLEGATGLWVATEDADELTDLPDDAEVYRLGDPRDGLQSVELVDQD